MKFLINYLLRTRIPIKVQIVNKLDLIIYFNWCFFKYPKIFIEYIFKSFSSLAEIFSNFFIRSIWVMISFLFSLILSSDVSKLFRINIVANFNLLSEESWKIIQYYTRKLTIGLKNLLSKTILLCCSFPVEMLHKI